MTDMPATADEPVRLLLVDDHPMMRKGVAQLLELEDDLSVVGERPAAARKPCAWPPSWTRT